MRTVNRILNRFGKVCILVCWLAAAEAHAMAPWGQPKPAPGGDGKATPSTASKTDPTAEISKSMEIDPKYRQVAAYIARFLQEEHFARHPIDEQVCLVWIEDFMKDLDYNKLFFLQSDVDEIKRKYGATIGTDLKRGEISPSLEIFQTFKKRFDARMATVPARLKQPFDFTKTETYNPDRTKSAWPKDAAEAEIGRAHV